MGRKASITAQYSQIKPTEIVGFHRTLQKWYKTYGRHDLPWRNTTNPYHIWLSEVMLQQTQVSTVLARFYHPFLKQFPTVEALAAAPREKVMKAWEGLGYYRRAGNLHEAAKKIVNSEWWSMSSETESAIHHSPLTIHQLLSLPGIGQNTAHAIAAFAYHQPVAILEANVKRVVARIFALATPTDKELWQHAEQLLNRDAPFDYNQAMMDLGSLICTPKNPSCATCPANSICQGKAAPECYPAPKAKKQTPRKEVMILVREDASGRFFLEKREENLLGGLYGFPQSERRSGNEQHVALRARREVAGGSVAWETRPPSMIGTVTHVYSHFKLIGHVIHEHLPSKTNSPNWHSRTEIAALPLSKLDHKVLALVENCHTGQKKRLKPTSARRAH